jgi:conjugative transposon TraJ protein
MDFENLHQILRSLYDEMMPLCSDMTDIAKGLAGLGALFYVALRVWQSLSRAEPIDVFPLLRPFAIGLAIMFFPTIVLGTLNSVMSPIVQGTHSMLETQTFDMNEYRAQKDKLEYEAMKRNPETAYLVSNEEFDKQLDELGWSPGDVVTMAGMYVERGMYSMKKSIRDFFRELLELLFQAAALVIDVLRTFFLIVLSILGPLCFAISVWDGFQSTLTQWFCRYIQIYLWLPVSDLFSTILAKIQVLMLQNDIEALQNDPNFSIEASNGVYIVFLIIGIIGYFTIPTVAGWIIQAGGGIGNYNRNVNTAGSLGGSIAGATAGNVDAAVQRASHVGTDFLGCVNLHRLRNEDALLTVIVIDCKLNRYNHAVVLNGLQGYGKPFALQSCHSDNDRISWYLPIADTHGFQQSQPYCLSVRYGLVAVDAGRNRVFVGNTTSPDGGIEPCRSLFRVRGYKLPVTHGAVQGRDYTPLHLPYRCNLGFLALGDSFLVFLCCCFSR